VPEIDNDTLLRAVYESVVRFERLLKSDTVREPEEHHGAADFLRRSVARVLKSAYREQLAHGARLPSREKMLFEKSSGW
jgi:hypothetical protein